MPRSGVVQRDGLGVVGVRTLPLGLQAEGVREIVLLSLEAPRELLVRELFSRLLVSLLFLLVGSFFRASCPERLVVFALLLALHLVCELLVHDAHQVGR